MRANVLVAARSEAPIDLTVFAASRSGSYATVLVIVLTTPCRFAFSQGLVGGALRHLLRVLSLASLTQHPVRRAESGSSLRLRRFQFGEPCGHVLACRDEQDIYPCKHTYGRMSLCRK